MRGTVTRVWPWVKRHIPVRPPPPSCHNGSQSQARPLQPSHYHTLSTCHLPARRNGNNQQHHSHQFFCHSNSELPKVILRWPILVFTRWEGVIKKFFLGLSPQSVTTPNSFVPRSQSDCNKILDWQVVDVWGFPRTARFKLGSKCPKASWKHQQTNGIWGSLSSEKKFALPLKTLPKANKVEC